MLASVRTVNNNTVQQIGQPYTFKFFAPNNEPPPTTWKEGIADTADNWRIQEVTVPGDRIFLAESVQRGNVIGVSGGSYCPHIQKGSAAAVLQ